MDVLVVGCGLTGSVIARHLAEQGKKLSFGSGVTKLVEICTIMWIVTVFSYKNMVLIHFIQSISICMII